MAHSFVVYIDESGDEGFKFRSAQSQGATLWFAISAVVVRRINEPRAVRIIDDVRQQLGKDRKYTLHFRHLKHTQRVMFCQQIARRQAIQIASVVAHKESLVDSTLISNSRLYFYATRMLLERVSWLCRDAPGRYKDGDGTCLVVFSNRSNLSYEDLRDYLLRLSNDGGCRIDWSVIRPEQVESAQHPSSKGLQIADAVASGFFQAFEPDPFENTEDRYARILLPRCYRYKGRLNSYGLKICCGNKTAQREIEQSVSWLDLRG